MASSSSRKRRKQRRRSKQRQAAAEPNPDKASESTDSGDSRLDRRAAAAASKRRRASDPEGPPPAPWGSFPLVEIVVLIGIVMAVVGLFAEGQTRIVMILTGLALGSVAGLELAVREHLAGYRSHTVMLAAIPALITFGLLYVALEMSAYLRLGLALAVGGAAGYGLVELFRDRSGGYAFRVAKPRR